MKIRRGILSGALLFAGGCAVPDGNPPVGDSTDATTTDATSCYEAPRTTEEHLALIGQPCEWPNAVECSMEPWLQCLQGKWKEYPFASGTEYSCDPGVEECAPAGKVTYEIVGVGFIGITHAGMARDAGHNLRQV